MNKLKLLVALLAVSLTTLANAGSLGSSGTNQQMVEHIQLTECIFQVIDNRQLTPTTNAIVPTVPTISKKIPE